MPLFAYRSSTREGLVAEGVIEAADEKAAVESLRDRGAIPLSVRAADERGFRRRLAARSGKADLEAFTAELSTLLTAGLPLETGLDILSGISGRRGMGPVAQSLLQAIRSGRSFSDALQQHPDLFPRFYISMVRAGEAGGVLHGVLERLGASLESARALRDQIVSAMVYPAVLAVTGGLSLILLLTFVLPRFEVIFAEMGSALPVSTQILLAASGFLKSSGWSIALLAAAGGFALRRAIATDRGRLRWDGLKLKLMGEIVGKLETARFCRTLGTLLASGVPLLQALNNAREVVGNRVIASAIEAVARGAQEGRGISEPLERTGLFPSLALSMIRVGEETGTLDRMLLQVAAVYEKGLKQTVQRFISLLEPVMILVMGLLIGFIVLSMLLAIFSISEIPL